MEYRQLGRSGLKVSAVGLGCNNFGRRCSQEATNEVVGKAVDLGVTMFDTADFYGAGLSEEFLGRALGARRKDVVIATKFGLAMGSGPYQSGGSRRSPKACHPCAAQAPSQQVHMGVHSIQGGAISRVQGSCSTVFLFRSQRCQSCPRPSMV